MPFTGILWVLEERQKALNLLFIKGTQLIQMDLFATTGFMH